MIDDLLPFDEEGNLLLPATSLSYELWPMLLTKALLKVAALESVIDISLIQDLYCQLSVCTRQW